MAILERMWECNSSSKIESLQITSHMNPAVLLQEHGHKWQKEKRLVSFKIKCLRKLLDIAYMEHKTNEYMRIVVTTIVAPQEPLHHRTLFAYMKMNSYDPTHSNVHGRGQVG